MSALERFDSASCLAHAPPRRRTGVGSDLAARLDAADITLPQLLRHRAQKLGEALAIREKHLGIWSRCSGRHYNDTARLVAFGLLSLGVRSGDRIAVASENTPQWFHADLGAQMLGASVVGIYPTNPWQELQYIVRHCGARIVFTGDQEQTDKVLEAMRSGDGLPAVDVIVLEKAKATLTDAELKSINRYTEAGYAAGRLLVEAMRRCGKDLTRACMIDQLERTQNLVTGVMAPISFGTGKRFSGQKVQIMQADFASLSYKPAP